MQISGSQPPKDWQNAGLYSRCSRLCGYFGWLDLSSKDSDQGLSDPRHQSAEQARASDLCSRDFETLSGCLDFDICPHFLPYRLRHLGRGCFPWLLSSPDWIHFECTFWPLPLFMLISWPFLSIYEFAAGSYLAFVAEISCAISPGTSVSLSIFCPNSLISWAKQSCRQTVWPQAQVLTNHEKNHLRNVLGRYGYHRWLSILGLLRRVCRFGIYDFCFTSRASFGSFAAALLERCPSWECWLCQCASQLGGFLPQASVTAESCLCLHSIDLDLVDVYLPWYYSVEFQDLMLLFILKWHYSSHLLLEYEIVHRFCQISRLHASVSFLSQTVQSSISSSIWWCSMGWCSPAHPSHASRSTDHYSWGRCQHPYSSVNLQTIHERHSDLPQSKFWWLRFGLIVRRWCWYMVDLVQCVDAISCCFEYVVAAANSEHFGVDFFLYRNYLLYINRFYCNRSYSAQPEPEQSMNAPLLQSCHESPAQIWVKLEQMTWLAAFSLLLCPSVSSRVIFWTSSALNHSSCCYSCILCSSGFLLTLLSYSYRNFSNLLSCLRSAFGWGEFLRVGWQFLFLLRWILFAFYDRRLDFASRWSPGH